MINIKTAKDIIKMAKKVNEIIKLDQNRRIIILQTFVWGKFKVDVPDFVCEDFEIIDNVMTIYQTGNRDPICDGSSLAPDEILNFNTIVSSIGHDCGYHYIEKIAEAWGWSISKVRKLFDDAFGCDLKTRAKSQTKTSTRIVGLLVSHVYHWFVRRFGGLYHSTKDKISILVISLLLCSGCGCAIPDVFEPSGVEVDYIISNIVDRVEVGKDTEVKSADAVNYSLLNWKYGGFNGKNAIHNSGVVIKNLKVNKNGMSYAWQSGNCEMLGAAGHTNADCLACLFCEVNGQWVGGKFDWISTSRVTRGFENIGGYHGWSWEVFNAASHYAFVIVSKDGRSRSNVIVSE